MYEMRPFGDPNPGPLGPQNAAPVADRSSKGLEMIVIYSKKEHFKNKTLYFDISRYQRYKNRKLTERKEKVYKYVKI